MQDTTTASIIIGGGCFWCIEAIFQRVKGVMGVEPGYAAGHTNNPTYREVCSGNTGHAEVCRVAYDTNTIDLNTVLTAFWLCHDPTTLNRQGHDVGTQYRSIILCETDEDIATATKSKRDAQSQFDAPIVTEIALLDIFYPAEVEHHDYFNQHVSAPYCQAVIWPKLKKMGLVE